jgi:ABC-type sugar transport system ATPase subunit
MDAVAKLVSVAKCFEIEPVVDRISVDFHRGEVVGLVGPNGSGKTTLMNLLCGALLPDSGEVWIKGKQVQLHSISEGMAEGVRLLPQFLQIYPSLNVLENIFTGQEIKRSFPFPKLMAWQQMEIFARDLLGQIGADGFGPKSLALTLSGGQQKAVALARLLVKPADILIFDESTDSLGIKQKNTLLEVMKAEASSGKAVVFISHDTEDVMAVCDRVIVLRRGKLVSDQKRDALDSESLAALMGII